MNLIDTVNGKTKVYGLMGHPIAHTLSPSIHNSLAKILNHDLIYVPFDVSTNGLKEALNGSYELGIQGLNVTIPHKEKIIPHLLEVEGYGNQIGAVNTLKRSEGGYIGYNTDAEGLLLSLIEEGITIKDKKVLIIGAGGAARAAAMMAAKENPKKLILTNRTLSRCEELIEGVLSFYDVPAQMVSLETANNQIEADVCIQTTSVGMYPNQEESPIYKDEFFKRISAAVDLIYNPWETIFIKKARDAGCRTMNGFGMLFYQAIRAYEIWNEISIPKDKLESLFAILKDKLNP
ncbi:MAG: shikimate dehydrogenase [Epulopiscium sp.]|nr:shikimate dehydrogenase [Candidatus Epulonipiscium sp.]